VAVVAAGCGTVSSFAYRGTTPPNAKRLMIEYLDAKHLDWRWVACLYTGRSFVGAPIVRCNVNFGDPHIQAYCSVLRGDKLVTQYDDAAIPCSHDDAGWNAPVQTQ
jgi:hypothetical protein